MTTGASVTTGDLLYATATDANVKPYPVQTPSFTTYTDTPITTFNTVAGAGSSGGLVRVAYLTTGDFVVVDAINGTTPTFQRYNSSGVAQGSLTTIETTGSITSLNISALASGNFVVAYNNTTTNVRAVVYNSTGTQLVAPFIVEAVNAASVCVAPMTSGGFVVVYNNATTNIRYGNYNIAGVLQGSLTTLVSGNYSSANTVDAKPLSDGKVAVCYALSTGAVRYAHIGTNGSISVADTLAFTANSTQTWPRICPTTNGSYILCVAYSTIVQNRVISSTGVMSPFPQLSAVSTATGSGRTAIDLPINITAGTQIQVAPNSVTGGGTMVFNNNTTSYYYRFDNMGSQISDFVGLQGTTSTFAARGIASNGNATVITYYNASTLPSFVMFSATTNANTTPAYITPTNSLITSTRLSRVSAMYGTSINIGWLDACTLNSGDIAVVAQSPTYSGGYFLTIMGQDGRFKLQKWVVATSGSQNSQVSIAALSNGGFVIAAGHNSNIFIGQYAFIYDSSINFVNSVKIDSTTSNTISVCGLVNGGFAVAYNNSTSNTYYAVYSNTGAVVLSQTVISSSNYSSAAGGVAVASMVDGGFVVAMAVTTPSTNYFARYTANGTQIVSYTSISGVGNTYTISAVGTPDNGFAVLYWYNSSAVAVVKYNSASSVQWTTALTPTTANNNYAIRMTYCPLNQYLVTHYAISGAIPYIHKISLTGAILNGDSSDNGQRYFNASSSNNSVPVSQVNDNTVILAGLSSSTLSLIYTTISQGYTIVGVAGESAATNTEIDVIVDGVTTLNKSYAPVTLSAFGANPAGVKGLVTGFTAELTRQRNNLG